MLDTLGGDATLDAFDVCRRGGAVVSVAGVPDEKFADQVGAGPVLRLLQRFISRKVLAKSRRTGIRYFRFLTESDGKQLAQISALVESGQVRPVVDSTFAFGELPAALERLAQGRSRGKIVLEVRTGTRRALAVKRHDVFVDAEGTRLAAWFYEPEASGPGPLPAVVMAHGLAGVKELNLDRFAGPSRRRASPCWCSTTANFGESPRARRARRSTRGHRCATTGTPSPGSRRTRAWTRAARGVGNELLRRARSRRAAVDDRVRCVVSQVPAITGSGARSRLPGETASALAAAFAADRRSRFSGGRPMTLQAIRSTQRSRRRCAASEVLEHHRLSQLESPAPTWQNEVTVRSLEMASSTSRAAMSNASRRGRCSWS